MRLEKDQRLAIGLLLLILIVAAILRLGWPGITEFKFDEASMFRRALLLAREGQWPVDVVSSIAGVDHPPLMAYLLAIPFVITRHPAAPVIWLGLLSVAAVFLTYVFGSRYFDRRVGLIASALFAAAPWAVFYSRRLWAQNVPLLTLLLILSLYGLIVDRRWRFIIPVIVLPIMLAGMYLGNLVFSVLVGVVLILHWRNVREAWQQAAARERWLSLLIAFGLIALLMIPMLPWLEEFLATPPTFSASDGEAESGLFVWRRLVLASQVATGHELRALAGDQVEAYSSRLSLGGVGSLVDQAMLWLHIVGMIYVVGCAIVARVRQENDFAHWSLLALWIVMPLAVWTASGLTPQPHRYIGLYPAQNIAVALLMVSGLEWFQERGGSARRVGVVFGGVSLVALVGILAWQINSYSVMMRLIVDTPINYGHGTPARVVWQAATDARELAASAETPIVVNGTGDDPAQDGEAAAFDALLNDTNLYLIEGEDVTVHPTQSYVHVLTRADATYGIEARTPENLSGWGDVTQLANGIEVIGVQPDGLDQMIRPGERVWVGMLWKVWGIPPDGADYFYTVQLFSEDGLQWANEGGPFLRTTYWQQGDVIRSAVVLPIPGDAPRGSNYHLVVAMNTFDASGQLQTVDVLDANSTPMGTYLTLPID